MSLRGNGIHAGTCGRDRSAAESECISGRPNVYAIPLMLPASPAGRVVRGGGMVRGSRRLSAKAIAPARVGLVRERLFSVAEGRLGLALAPAGYGKTRLLAQVADTFDGAVCWYR